MQKLKARGSFHFYLYVRKEGALFTFIYMLENVTGYQKEEKLSKREYYSLFTKILMALANPGE